MEIGTAISTLRKERGFSQKDFAKLCDLSVNALCQIENNNSFPNKRNLKTICVFLSVPISYLLLFSISEEDVPEEKIKTFNVLNNALKELLLM